MKNKSKLKKAGQKSTLLQGIPGNWFYMNEQEITVRTIKESLETETEFSLEIWEDAGVLEIEIPEKKSMDLEQTKTDLRDEYSNDYLKQHNIKSLFFVSMDVTDYENVKKIMQKITQSLGGFFCGDTENFEPVVK